MENVVKRKINESISVDRLRAISSFKVILYEDLVNIKDLNDLDACILYMPVERRNNGHFICMWKDDKLGYYNYFDSYGLSPYQTSRESQYMYETKIKDEDYLLNLMLKYKQNGGIITYNTKQFQKLNTSTCWRYCIMRLRHKDLTHKEFEEFMKYKNISYDELITLYTIDL